MWFWTRRTCRIEHLFGGETVAVIRDGDMIAIDGFVGIRHPEEFTAALEGRFLDTRPGKPVPGLRGGSGWLEGSGAFLHKGSLAN